MNTTRRSSLPVLGFVAALVLAIGAALYLAPDAAPAVPHKKTAAEIARDACQPVKLGEGGMTFCATATLDPSGIIDSRDRRTEPLKPAKPLPKRPGGLPTPIN